MSRIDDLVADFCPGGVEYRAIGELGQVVRGNGMPKTDFTESGVGAIHYGQIYTFYGTWTTETLSFVAPETAAKLAKVDPGDLIITNTSENLEDVGKAVAWLGSEHIVTGGHATVLKHGEDPKFLAYWFQTPEFFAQKKKLASGTKVIDVSAKNLAKIRIPVPPMEVQREIARILDTFSALEAELEAELEARRVQYGYYRDSLLTFDEEVPYRPLGDLCSVFNGYAFDSSMFNTDDVGLPLIRIRDVNTGYSETFYSGAYDARFLVHNGDILIGMDGDFRRVRWSHGTGLLNQRVCRLQEFSPEVAPYYLFHIIQDVLDNIHAGTQGSTVKHLSSRQLERFRIPVPPLAEQERIVTILDNFDALLNDVSVGLPAELAARRKQYEHYRDRLLTFEEVPA